MQVRHKLLAVGGIFKTYCHNVEDSTAVFAEVPHCTIREGRLEEQARTGWHRHRRIGSWISRAACPALCQFVAGKGLGSESDYVHSKKGGVGGGGRR